MAPAIPPLPVIVYAREAGAASSLPPAVTPRRNSWARLLKRVLDVDALTCPRCGAAMVVIAFITDPTVIKNILDYLHLPTADPPRAPARAPLEQMRLGEEFTEECGDDSLSDPPPQQRGPP